MMKKNWYGVNSESWAVEIWLPCALEIIPCEVDRLGFWHRMASKTLGDGAGFPGPLRGTPQ